MKKKKTPQGAAKNFFGAFSTAPFPQNLNLEKDGFENFQGPGGRWGRGGGSGGRWGRGGGGLELEQAAPLDYKYKTTRSGIKKKKENDNFRKRLIATYNGNKGPIHNAAKSLGACTQKGCSEQQQKAGKGCCSWHQTACAEGHWVRLLRATGAVGEG